MKSASLLAAMEAISCFNDAKFQWLNDPTRWPQSGNVSGEAEGDGGHYEIGNDGAELTISAPAKKDFWSKTFYSPLLVKSDASAYVCQISTAVEATINVEFSYNPVTQFDQAGLLVYVDDKHWVKCGIEYCDNSPRLSVVVCNDFSDWSTQPWHATSVVLKVHKVNQSDSIVVEAAPAGSTDFHFIRIAHLSCTSKDGEKLPWQVGPYAACPIAQKGCSATFKNFSIGSREPSVHSENL